MPLDSDTYSTSQYGQVDLVDAAATYDEAANRAAVFLVNRGTTDPATVTIDARALGTQIGIIEAPQLCDTDPYAKNTLHQPDRITLHDAATTTINGGLVTLTLPPASWTALSLG